MLHHVSLEMLKESTKPDSSIRGGRSFIGLASEDLEATLEDEMRLHSDFPIVEKDPGDVLIDSPKKPHIFQQEHRIYHQLVQSAPLDHDIPSQDIEEDSEISEDDFIDDYNIISPKSFKDPSNLLESCLNLSFSTKAGFSQALKLIELPTRRNSVDVTRNVPFQRQKAFNALEELLQSEETYCKRIEALYTHFPRRLEALCSIQGIKPILSQSQTEKLFLNLSEIVELSLHTIETLKCICREDEPFRGIGNVIHALTTRMEETFTYYAVNFDASLVRKGILMKSNWKFSEFVSIGEFVLGQSVDALRIMPVQRVMRYILLLKEMKRHFAGDSIEFKSLQKAYDSVEAVVRHINVQVKSAESSHFIRLLEERLFKGKITLTGNDRVFIRMDSLTKYYSKSRLLRNTQGKGSKKDYVFLLFSDVLVYASVSSMTGTATFKHALPLGGLELTDLGDSKSLPNAFRVKSSYKSFILSASTAELKTEWMHDLRKAVVNIEGIYDASGIPVPVGRSVEMEIRVPLDMEREVDEVLLHEKLPWQRFIE